ncbi:unnamed protein product [Sphagnum balticum]
MGMWNINRYRINGSCLQKYLFTYSSRRTKQRTRYDKKETATSRSRKRTNACRFLKQVCHA